MSEKQLAKFNDNSTRNIVTVNNGIVSLHQKYIPFNETDSISYTKEQAIEIAQAILEYYEES